MVGNQSVRPADFHISAFTLFRSPEDEAAISCTGLQGGLAISQEIYKSFAGERREDGRKKRNPLALGTVRLSGPLLDLRRDRRNPLQDAFDGGFRIGVQWRALRLANFQKQALIVKREVQPDGRG